MRAALPLPPNSWAQAYTRLHVTQAGRLDGRTFRAIEPILARVDELLWYFPALHLNRRARRLVEAADSDVLLEADFGERSVEP
nr:hypothetical protein [Leptolyngbya sp. NK1-12]